MNCGWMSAESHTGESVFVTDDGTEFAICPGYTTTLPDVIDIAMSFHHWENGAMREVCPSGVPKPLLVGLSLFKNSGETRASFRMKEQTERQKEANRRGG